MTRYLSRSASHLKGRDALGHGMDGCEVEVQQPANLDLFEDPITKKYAPPYGGYCAYGVIYRTTW